MFSLIKKKRKPSLCFIAFLQAFGVNLYCGLVSLIFWRGNDWFGPIRGYLGPVLFLTLFVVSALISALIVLGYPVFLFWEKKERLQAIKLTAYTASWLLSFVILIISLILIL